MARFDIIYLHSLSKTVVDTAVLHVRWWRPDWWLHEWVPEYQEDGASDRQPDSWCCVEPVGYYFLVPASTVLESYKSLPLVQIYSVGPFSQSFSYGGPKEIMTLWRNWIFSQTYQLNGTSIPFEEGDVLGFHQPSKDDSRLRIHLAVLMPQPVQTM